MCMHVLGFFKCTLEADNSNHSVSTDLCAYSTFMMYYHSLLGTAGIQQIYLKKEGSLSWLLLHG